MKTVHVLIPVLNEAPNIPSLALGLSKWKEEIPGYAFRFIFINDGSTDETPRLLDELSGSLPVSTLHHKTCQGPGKAFATGFASLAGKLGSGDMVVTMEGDNTSRPHILRLMLGRVEREGNDVVLASPYTYGGGLTNTSLLRTFLSHAANGLMKMVLNLHGLNTFSSFYRLYTADAIKTLQTHYGNGILENKGFECMVELLYKMALLRFSISEVAMRLDTSLRKGKSKMKILRTMRGYLRVMWMKDKWKRKES